MTKLTEENFEKTCCVLAVIQTTNFTGGIKKYDADALWCKGKKMIKLYVWL